MSTRPQVILNPPDSSPLSDLLTQYDADTKTNWVVRQRGLSFKSCIQPFRHSLSFFLFSDSLHLWLLKPALIYCSDAKGGDDDKNNNGATCNKVHIPDIFQLQLQVCNYKQRLRWKILLQTDERTPSDTQPCCALASWERQHTGCWRENDKDAATLLSHSSSNWMLDRLNPFTVERFFFFPFF